MVTDSVSGDQLRYATTSFCTKNQISLILRPKARKNVRCWAFKPTVKTAAKQQNSCKSLRMRITAWSHRLPSDQWNLSRFQMTLFFLVWFSLPRGCLRFSLSFLLSPALSPFNETSRCVDRACAYHNINSPPSGSLICSTNLELQIIVCFGEPFYHLHRHTGNTPTCVLFSSKHIHVAMVTTECMTWAYIYI